jgi:TusA-related sulfurtransferase
VRIDLEELGLESGGEVLLRRAMRRLAPGEQLEIAGRHAELSLQLRTWCRLRGHRFAPSTDVSGVCGTITPDTRTDIATERAGGAAPAGVMDRPPRHWGLAGRSAQVELGGPRFDFGLVDKLTVWTDDAARLYARAAAAQWDPERAIDWATPIDNDPEIEDAVVQVMTYLIENETAALLVPARFLGRVHPHFREIMQVLAIQAADEARHIEVFTRRALLKRDTLGLSTSQTSRSLRSCSA